MLHSLRSLRVVFFGTPTFAIPTLDLLCEQTNVIACVTQPDKPRGRGHRVEPSAVKQRAQILGIPVLQPRSLAQSSDDGQKFLEQWNAWKPDIAIVVAYGIIIPPHLLNQSAPSFGFLNVHPSLLPAFRGPTPIPAALCAGLTTTGVTIMKLDSGVDTGPILAQRVVPMTSDDTAVSLGSTCATVGAVLLCDTLPDYIAGLCVPERQQERHASITRQLRKEDGWIRWNEPPEIIERKIRAFSPWPGASTFCGTVRVKILRASLVSGALHIEEVQPEGKQKMPYADFLHGYQCSLPPGRRS